MVEFRPGKADLVFEMPFEGAWPTSVAFIGANRLAAGNGNGQLFVWDLPEKAEKPAPLNPIRQLEGHTNGITRLVSPGDGKWLISASLDRTVRMWDLSASLAGTAEVVLDAQTRAQLARRKRDKSILTRPGIKVAVQKESIALTGHTDWVKALGLSGDGKRLISGDDNAQVIVWDLASRKQVANWKGYPWNWMVSAALDADGKTALVSEYRHKRDDFDLPAPALRLWNVAEKKVQRDFLQTHLKGYKPNETSYGAARVWRKFVARGLLGTAFSPDGKLIAVGQGGETGTGKVHLFEVATGKLKRTVSGHRYGVTDLTFSADGRHLLSVGRDTSVRITRVDTGKEVQQLGKPRGGQFKDWLHAVALGPDQKWLAAADIAGKVLVWRFQ